VNSHAPGNFVVVGVHHDNVPVFVDEYPQSASESSPGDGCPRTTRRRQQCGVGRPGAEGGAGGLG